MGLYQYDSTEDKLNLVAGSTNFSDAPVGAIFPFGGTDIPISFLLCDGSAVSRTDYEDLFAVIGTAFGTGDGSTTFNLPDLREAVPKGAGLTGKTVGAHLDADGLAVGEFLDDRIKQHNHSITDPGHTHSHYAGTSFGNRGGDYNSVPVGTSSATGSSKTNITINNTGSATNEVKSVGVNYIIKAKQVGMPTDFASAVGDIVVDKNTYSTSETIVGKWIDGKPLYRKVIVALNQSTISAGEWVTMGTISDIDSLSDVRVTDCGSSSFMFTNLIARKNGSNVQVLVTGQGWSASASGSTRYVIIEYTKTTDG